MPRRPHPALALLAPAPLAIALFCAGCDSLPKFPPACPRLALLRDAADVTRYAPGTHDIRGLIIDGRITAVPATCAFAAADKVRASLTAAFEVSRGPAAPGRDFALPYFVAVTNSGRIVDEADYTLTGAFPINTDTLRLSGKPVDLLIPITKDTSAAAYQVFVGFRLTPDELEVNRQRGPR